MKKRGPKGPRPTSIATMYRTLIKRYQDTPEGNAALLAEIRQWHPTAADQTKWFRWEATKHEQERFAADAARDASLAVESGASEELPVQAVPATTETGR